MKEIKLYIKNSITTIKMHHEALGLRYSLYIFFAKINNFPLHELLPDKVWKAIKAVIDFISPDCWYCSVIRWIVISVFATYMVMK